MEVRKYDTLGVTYKVLSTETTETGLNISKESSLIPLRFGINAGLGTEFRIAGTTAAFINVNFFRSFTNQMKKESKTTFYQSSGGNYKYVKQNLKYTAIRINLGIMF